MAIEIVDLPINSMVIFHSYVSLPEDILILTSLLVWEYLRSPAKNLVYFLQAIWLIGNGKILWN